MKIHSTSAFKDPAAGKSFLDDWNQRVIAQSGTSIQALQIDSPLGKTQVWRTGLSDAAAPALVIFPGFRTASLIWELDGLLAPLRGLYRIHLVDTNGQPTLSEGHTPDIKGPGYGEWAVAVLDALGLGSATVMGASFGGLVCLKLAAQAPGRVVRAFLLNPGCLTGFSLAPRNLFYNLLPIFSPSEKNVRRFLDNAVWHKPSHQLSEKGADLLVEYEVYVLKHWRDKAQKPYVMPAAELQAAKAEVHLLVGDQDPLFPYQKSIAHARAHLPQLASVKVFSGVAHGIELSAAAIAHVASFHP